VGPRAGLGTVAKRKILPCWESNPEHPVHSLVTILTELSWLTAQNSGYRNSWTLSFGVPCIEVTLILVLFNNTFSNCKMTVNDELEYI
jgi:hypothetical protein